MPPRPFRAAFTLVAVAPPHAKVIVTDGKSPIFLGTTPVTP
jgi:hypothetical protein